VKGFWRPDLNWKSVASSKENGSAVVSVTVSEKCNVKAVSVAECNLPRIKPIRF